MFFSHSAANAAQLYCCNHHEGPPTAKTYMLTSWPCKLPIGIRIYNNVYKLVWIFQNANATIDGEFN